MANNEALILHVYDDRIIVAGRSGWFRWFDAPFFSHLRLGQPGLVAQKVSDIFSLMDRGRAGVIKVASQMAGDEPLLGRDACDGLNLELS